MAIVVVDAGHGGHDPGAVRGTRLEKNDNLRMALAVGRILQNCGVNVVYTRTTDVFIPLVERSNISNRARADLFISVHRNASVNPAAHGVENWVFTTPSARSLDAATRVLNNVVAAGVQSNRGIKRGNFAVLRNTIAPAMLFEYGFISNAEDNRLFDANFDAYARATANGIMEHLGIRCGATPPVTPPPTPPVPPVTPTPPSVGNVVAIRNIQQELNNRYNAGIPVTGVWGPLSRRALTRAYQTELNRMFNAGLVVDGIFGPRTRAATRLVRMGDRNNLVWILQAGLVAHGFPLSTDGVFGPITLAQVNNFQRANNLTVTGIAGPQTFERLLTA